MSLLNLVKRILGMKKVKLDLPVKSIEVLRDGNLFMVQAYDGESHPKSFSLLNASCMEVAEMEAWKMFPTARIINDIYV